MARRLVSLLLLPTLSHRLLARRFRTEERILGRGTTGGRGRRARGFGRRGGGIRFLTLSAQTLGNFAFRPGAVLLAPWKYRRCLERRHRGHIFRTVANSIRIEASISSIDHRCLFHVSFAILRFGNERKGGRQIVAGKKYVQARYRMRKSVSFVRERKKEREKERERKGSKESRIVSRGASTLGRILGRTDCFKRRTRCATGQRRNCCAGAHRLVESCTTTVASRHRSTE